MAPLNRTSRWILWIGIPAALLAIAAYTGSSPTPAPVQSAAPIAVEVTPVAAGHVVESVAAVGTVAALRDVTVSSETAGRITRVAVNVGDPVRAGQTLVVVDDELKAVAVDQARAQKLAAETSMKKAERDYRRAEMLFASGDIADTELEGNRLALHAAEAQFKGAEAGLRAAERQLRDTRIASPVTGLVAARMVELGEMVSPGREIANVVDVSALKIKVSIAEGDIPKVRLRQPVTVRLDARSGYAVEGTVSAVGSKTESPTVHTYPVEITVKKADKNIMKIGMFARVEIRTSTAANTLMVSKESLVGDEGTPGVFVAENNVARLRQVKLGIRSAEHCQVLDGLKPGDLVISFGQKGLKDGAPVQYTTPSH